jgi:alkyl hydroperoxide reductase subunit AhpC
VAARHEDFRQAGVQVVAVSMSPADGVARYLDTHSLPVPLVADPDRKLYSALGLGRTSWARLLRPGLIWKYLKLIARGGKVRSVPRGEDPLQLGGDFLIDRDRRVLWAYRSADPADRPTVDELLRVARTAVDNRSDPV